MNMKKTMAAIAAGAVAVSAMATTVSAETLPARTLNYNLVSETCVKTYTITTKTEFINVPLVDGQKATFTLLGADAVNKDVTVKVYGNYTDANKGVVQMTSSAKPGTLDYNPSLPMQAGANAGDCKIVVDVVASNDLNNPNVLAGGLKNGDDKILADGTTTTLDADEPIHANLTVQITYVYDDSGSGRANPGFITRDWGDDVMIEDANGDIRTQKIGAKLSVDAAGVNVYTNDGSTVLVNAPTMSKDISKHPYKSCIDNNYTDGLVAVINLGGNFTPNANTGDVIQHVWTDSDNDGLVDDQVSPNSIRSVINDCISKYDDVSFVFNTAAAGVKADGTYAAGTWEGDWKYTSFGLHYFGGTPGYTFDGTDYITSSWLGNNLFSGAVIINNNLTLSLAEAQKFDWTQTSLTFSWDAIQDEALTQNQYANYIQNMVLRTSTDWYWDNFQVVLGETEVEEVESGAPVEGDKMDLEEEEEEEEEYNEFEEEEEEEEESEPEPEPAPVVASNPSTGNAPVALAVIPVALAAAAIVAKKRG